jgi:hypothetical protein
MSEYEIGANPPSTGDPAAEPRTAAGRTLLHDSWRHWSDPDNWRDSLRLRILAIEAEAKEMDSSISGTVPCKCGHPLFDACGPAARQPALPADLLRRLLAGIDKATIEDAGADFWDAVEEAAAQPAAPRDGACYCQRRDALGPYVPCEMHDTSPSVAPDLCDCLHPLPEHTDRGKQDAGLCLHGGCDCPEFVEIEGEPPSVAPVRCPVCDGHGRRIPMYPLPVTVPSVECHACKGRGYLGEPPSVAPDQRYAPGGNAEHRWGEPPSVAPDPIGPVRITSANCRAGDHDDCLGMVEQDVAELGITDCLCSCHAPGEPPAQESQVERKR